MGFVLTLLIVLLHLPLVASSLGLGLALVLALRRRIRQAASVAGALAAPALLWPQICWTADYVHLALTAGLGAGTLGPATVNDSSFSVHDWSIGFAGSPSTFLIHDVSDEIALPPKMHKHPLASEHGFGEDCAGNVRRLLGHYYVCTF